MKIIAARLGVLPIICAILAGGFSATAGQGIRWKSGVEALPRVEPAQLPATVAQLAGQGQARHVVVQFDRPLGLAERSALRNAGLSLLRPLGSDAFFAALSSDAANVTALGGMTFISGMQRVERKWKLHPSVAARRVPEWAEAGRDAKGGQIVAVYVLFHADVSLADEAIPTAERHGVVVRDRMESINGLVAELPLARLETFADEDAVQWIEWPLPRLSPANDSNRNITEADAVNSSPYNLSGFGITVLVYDVGQAWADHPDLSSNLDIGYRDTSSTECHSTHVACTVGGQGADTYKYRGMAPGVDMVSYGIEHDGTNIPLYSNPGDLEDDYEEAIDIYMADIANNSIGSNIELNVDRNAIPVSSCDYQGDYGATSALIDAIVEGSFGRPFRVVWAAGNERPGEHCAIEGYGEYYSVAPPAGAKNHIAVGAVNSDTDSMTSFSSWGPTDDGRLKPDICAPGCQVSDDEAVTSCSYPADNHLEDVDCVGELYVGMCGTSMATPTVTGLAALLLEDYRTRFPSADDPRNSTLKALLVQNAVDRGNQGPDYQYGFGSVRIQDTIDFMRSGKFLESQMFQGDTFVLRVWVETGTPELKVTLAWDDYPGVPNTAQALVHDLDLRAFSPSSQRHFPWTLNPYSPEDPAAQAHEDHTNNIEQIVVANPEAGEWRIEVYGKDISMGAQSFSLTHSAPTPSTGCEGDNTWDGCGTDACHICSEKLADYDCYFDNHPGCGVDTTCYGTFADCNVACPEPTEEDRCTPMTDTCIPVDYGPYLSRYSGYNCTGTESYYTLYKDGLYDCAPIDTDDAVCGDLIRTEAHRSYRKYDTMECVNFTSPATFGNMVKVYREGVPPAFSGYSVFSGANCTGDEFYDTNAYQGREDCAPYNCPSAVCGDELRKETVLSYRDWACHNYAAPLTQLGLVRVYRGCGVDGTEECGNADCNGRENCYTCSQDCGECSCVEPDGEYISHFTGLNCTGEENYYRPYEDGLHACAPADSENALCGTELLTQTHFSYRQSGHCYNAWPDGNTLPGFVRVHRGGCGAGGEEECGNGECNGMETCETCPWDCSSCCVEAEGEGVSWFSGPDCTGDEYFDFLTPWSSLPFFIYSPCRPEDYAGAVCGTEYHTATVRSWRGGGVCENSSEGSTRIGLVRVYRDGCVAEPAAYCGDGSCNGLEMCATCPGDCGGPCCGNGSCDWFESVLDCPGECPGFKVGEHIEAEWGRITPPMQVESEGSETWVTTPQGTVDPTGAAAEYEVWIEEAGNYYIWTRVRAMDVWQDSFYVTVLDPGGDPVNIGTASTAIFRLDTADPAITYGAFSGTFVNHWWNWTEIEYNYVPAVYYLSPGVHTIRFTMRDLGTQLEALRVDEFPFPCGIADLDNDGWTGCEGDCWDKKATVNPGVAENCYTSYDDDCDGSINEGCDGGDIRIRPERNEAMD